MENIVVGIIVVLILVFLSSGIFFWRKRNYRTIQSQKPKSALLKDEHGNHIYEVLLIAGMSTFFTEKITFKKNQLVFYDRYILPVISHKKNSYTIPIKAVYTMEKGKLIIFMKIVIQFYGDFSAQEVSKAFDAFKVKSFEQYLTLYYQNNLKNIDVYQDTQMCLAGYNNENDILWTIKKRLEKIPKPPLFNIKGLLHQELKVEIK